MKMHIEITDTYGGQTNYSWVTRYEVEIPAGLSDRAIVRLAKREAGWTGVRCEKENYGDTIELRPRGRCVVMFVTFDF